MRGQRDSVEDDPHEKSAAFLPRPEGGLRNRTLGKCYPIKLQLLAESDLRADGFECYSLGNLECQTGGAP